METPLNDFFLVPFFIILGVGLSICILLMIWAILYKKWSKYFD